MPQRTPPFGISANNHFITRVTSNSSSNGHRHMPSLATPTPMPRNQINAAAARLYLMDSSQRLHSHDSAESPPNSQITAAEAFLNSPSQSQINKPTMHFPARSLDSSQASDCMEFPDEHQVLDGVYLPNKITYQQCPTEPPNGGSAKNTPTEPVVDITLSYTLYTRKVADPFAGASIKKGSKPGFIPGFIPYKIRPQKTQFQLTRTPLVALKDKLFLLANQINPSPNSDGNADILKQADALGDISIEVYIAQHPTFAKNQERKITSDEHMKEFFDAIVLHPTKQAGIHVSMKDPARKAREDEAQLSISHARVVAKNVKNSKPTTASTIVESIPMPDKKQYLADLLTKYTTAHNNSREGWRIYSRDDVTMVMDISHAHMVVWAEELTKKNSRASLEKPPDYLDNFVWEGIKRPLSLSTPAKYPKTKASAPGPTSQPTSTPISQQPDFSEVDRLVKKATLDLFLVFAKVPDDKLPHVSKTLYEYDITNFDMFLPPEDFTARDVQKLGISWGISKRLFREAPKYYRHLLEREAAEALNQSVSNESSHSGTSSDDDAEFEYDDFEDE